MSASTRTCAMRAALLLSLGMAILASGCSGPTLQTEKDSNAKIADYRTYSWVTPDTVGVLRLDNPPIDYLTGGSRIVERKDIERQVMPVIDQSLGQNGFTLATSGTPDFYVTYYGKAPDEDWVSTWNGYVPSVNNVPVIMYPGYEESATRSYREGSIVIVIYDTRSRKPAWSGTILEVLKPQDEVDQNAVTASIGELMGEFKRTA